MAGKVTTVTVEGDGIYRRISLEFMSAFPGQVYLRFEPHAKAPAIMIQVLPEDIVAISALGDPDYAVASVKANEPADEDIRNS